MDASGFGQCSTWSQSEAKPAQVDKYKQAAALWAAAKAEQVAAAEYRSQAEARHLAAMEAEKQAWSALVDSAGRSTLSNTSTNYQGPR